MTKIDLEFAELHAPLFFLGKNFGLKLDEKRFAGIKMTYDTDHQWLVVGWQDRVTYVPSTNVANMTPAVAKKVKAVKEEKPVEHPDIVPAVLTSQPPQVKVTAQVEGPQSHVFAGPGHGKR